MDKPSLFVHGMHGLGDNLHQRAVLRLLTGKYDIWLQTPWPSVYHDMRIHLVDKGSSLRTQAKNAIRERAKFTTSRPPAGKSITVSYSPQSVRARGQVLLAMAETCGVTGDLDFRLPIPDEWKARAQVWLDHWKPKKPILLYRPLNERKEWGGCAARNPDHEAYATLTESISDRYFIVSIADFEDGREWMVGRKIRADVELHAGELDFETLAALTQQAALVFTSPGFLVILGQAVGTPGVVVFGGYENGKSFTGGARFAPYLPIDPINPCECFSHAHDCQKRIDLPRAIERLADFAKCEPA